MIGRFYHVKTKSKGNHVAVAEESDVHFEWLPHAVFGHLGFVDWNFTVLFIHMWSEGKERKKIEDIENAVETARRKRGTRKLPLDDATHVVHFLALHDDRSAILFVQLQWKRHGRFSVYELGENRRSLTDEVLSIESDLQSN